MDHLEVLDSRTGKSYKIPIDNGYISASELGKITVEERGLINGDGKASTIPKGLRILDIGYQNTACVESKITFM